MSHQSAVQYTAVQTIKQLCSQPDQASAVMEQGIYKKLIDTITSKTVDSKTLVVALQAYYMLSNNLQYWPQLFNHGALNMRLLDLATETSDNVKIKQLATHVMGRYREYAAEQQQNSKENTAPRQSMKHTDMHKVQKNRLTRIPLKIHGVTTVQQQKALEVQLVKIAGVVSVTVSGILPNIDFIVYTTAEESELLNEIVQNINSTPNQSYRAEKTADRVANRFSVRNGSAVNSNAPQHNGAVAAYTDLTSSTTSQRSIAERRKLQQEQQNATMVGSVLKSVTSFFW